MSRAKRGKSRKIKARQSKSRQGKARQGKARQGKARQSKPSTAVSACNFICNARSRRASICEGMFNRCVAWTELYARVHAFPFALPSFLLSFFFLYVSPHLSECWILRNNGTYCWNVANYNSNVRKKEFTVVEILFDPLSTKSEQLSSVT